MPTITTNANRIQGGSENPNTTRFPPDPVTFPPGVVELLGVELLPFGTGFPPLPGARGGKTPPLRKRPATAKIVIRTTRVRITARIRVGTGTLPLRTRSKTRNPRTPSTPKRTIQPNACPEIVTRGAGPGE